MKPFVAHHKYEGDVLVLEFLHPNRLDAIPVAVCVRTSGQMDVLAVTDLVVVKGGADWPVGLGDFVAADPSKVSW